MNKIHSSNMLRVWDTMMKINDYLYDIEKKNIIEDDQIRRKIKLVRDLVFNEIVDLIENKYYIS